MVRVNLHGTDQVLHKGSSFGVRGDLSNFLPARPRRRPS
jgi:hypothetical protein